MRVARRFIGLHLGKAVKMTAYEMISSIILPTLFDEEPIFLSSGVMILPSLTMKKLSPVPSAMKPSHFFSSGGLMTRLYIYSY